MDHRIDTQKYLSPNKHGSTICVYIVYMCYIKCICMLSANLRNIFKTYIHI